MRMVVVFFKQKAAYEIRPRDWSSSVCSSDLLMPQAPGMNMAMEVKPGAKTVDGTALDQFSMKFNFDKNTPEAAQAQQMITMMYGPNGLNGYMGALSDRNYLMVMGGDDELLNTALQ